MKFTPVKQDILKQQPSLIDITKSEAEMIDCKETLESALGAMKRVTEMVNEGVYNVNTIKFYSQHRRSLVHILKE